jgi:hypothetical protein
MVALPILDRFSLTVTFRMALQTFHNESMGLDSLLSQAHIMFLGGGVASEGAFALATGICGCLSEASYGVLCLQWLRP